MLADLISCAIRPGKSGFVANGVDASTRLARATMRRISPRFNPLAPPLAAFSILAAERLSILLGTPSRTLALASLLVAPGAAVVPLLPRGFEDLTTRLAVIPPLS